MRTHAPAASYVEGAALVSGRPAAYTARLLKAALARSGATDRPLAEELIATLHALERAAAHWRASSSGNREAPTADALAASPHDHHEITSSEAARMLGVTPRRLRQLVADGRLEARKVAGRLLVDRDAVLALADERTAA